MDFKTYLHTFESILNAEEQQAPYNDAGYLNYTKLNWSRMNRWLKKGKLAESTVESLKKIAAPQHWILITEPWCGDAAHSVPFIAKMAEQNPLIHLELELRDSAPFRIEQYLTNGGKSIPILIVKDEDGNDLFHWGPRPKELQEQFLTLKEKGVAFEETKIFLQNWYNHNEGALIQSELVSLLETTYHKTLS